ncbi:MAG: hypothetical protein A3H35_03470 [Betaproteobacteria bacterium RIFCSPLOWO2_02_FULL_62_17]|nr:MAG: hypothetical protein A3H35_03470 [Betaproteobacteria bacterium RIFCSPLOWO2_02_FULL_62_17]
MLPRRQAKRIRSAPEILFGEAAVQFRGAQQMHARPGLSYHGAKVARGAGESVTLISSPV